MAEGGARLQRGEGLGLQGWGRSSLGALPRASHVIFLNLYSSGEIVTRRGETKVKEGESY